MRTEVQTDFITSTIYKDFPKRLQVAKTLDSGLFYAQLTEVIDGLFPYCLVNPSNAYNSIVLDIDYNWLKTLSDEALPTPNIAVINTENNHAHLFFALEKPVHKNRTSSEKALHYLSDVAIKMTFNFKADSNFTGYIGKNACYDGWSLYVGRLQPYTLEELNGWFDPVPKGKVRQVISEARVESRNCALFDKVRQFAYKERYKYDTLARFMLAIGDFAEKSNNIDFDCPLYPKEVKTLVKSVCTWVWRHFQNKEQHMAWSKANSIKGSKVSVKVRQAKSENRAELCKALKAERYTQEQIASRLGITRRQVANLLAKSTTDKQLALF